MVMPIPCKVTVCRLLYRLPASVSVQRLPRRVLSLFTSDFAAVCLRQPFAPPRRHGEPRLFVCFTTPLRYAPHAAAATAAASAGAKRRQSACRKPQRRRGAASAAAHARRRLPMMAPRLPPPRLTRRASPPRKAVSGSGVCQRRRCRDVSMFHDARAFRCGRDSCRGFKFFLMPLTRFDTATRQLKIARPSSVCPSMLILPRCKACSVFLLIRITCLRCRRQFHRRNASVL